MSKEQRAAVMVAAEDILVDDYVAPMKAVDEFLMRDDVSPAGGLKTMVVEWLPCAVETMRVRGVCLPFVLVETPCGGRRTIDVRQVRLGRLSKAFGREAFRPARKKKRRVKTKRQKRRD